MNSKLNFSGRLPKSFQNPSPVLVFFSLFLTLSSYGSSAQDSKAPLTPEMGRLFLNNAAESARSKARDKFKTFEEFKKSVTKEPFSGGKYIVNGDTPISTDAELERFYNETIVSSPGPNPEFAILNIAGKDIIWSADKRKALTYCVSSAAAEAGGFGGRYNTVVTAMADATKAWESIGNIDFIHVDAEDANCTEQNKNVLFDVRPVSFNQYLARAFFPNDDRPQRNVLIDSSSFELPPGGRLSLTGILRHELGHTLGARHEHTRPQSGTCFEDEDWRGVTDYDALSVMHYPQCNGKGDWSLTLTHLDKNGTACLYGPAPEFTIDESVCKPK